MDYLVKFRYYPGDPLITIENEGLKRVAEARSLEINLEEIKGDMGENGEKTLNKNLEMISQTIITISGNDVNNVKKGLCDIIRVYRSPRTVFSLWGSNDAGEKVAWEIIEEMDGWW